MVTLRNLYTSFAHDPQWQRLATKCLQPMISIYLRKLGNKDIATITDFDLQMQVAMSEQPIDVKAPAQSCMNHLRNWAKEHGKPFAEPEQEQSREQSGGQVHDSSPKNHATCPPDCPERKETAERKKRVGTVYHDTASKGYSKTGKRVFKDCWRAEITIGGQRYRHRSKEREDCEAWLAAVKQGKIKPTDNKADWWRMEQRKDEEARIDELIVSAAEEANIVYEYRQTGDTEILYDYCIKALLPHMVYYCAHTLRLGRDRSLTCSRQAVGLILTKIVGGRPVTNITFTCKRMLRTYKDRGDFWHYEKCPEVVKMMVNRIDMSALEELYKVTKDRRI